jgi:hypothetical protein
MKKEEIMAAKKKALKKDKATKGQKKLAELQKRISALNENQKGDVRKRMRELIPKICGEWDGTPEGMRMLIARGLEYGLSYYGVLVECDLLIKDFHEHWAEEKK